MGFPSFTANSDQWAKLIGQGHEPLAPTDHYGRQRISKFNVTVPSGGLVDTNTVGLVKIPDQALITRVAVAHNDAGAVADNLVGIIGADASGYLDKDNTVADDPDFFTGALDTTAAGGVEVFPITHASWPYLTLKELMLQFTAGGTLTAGKLIWGLVEYIVD